MFLEWKMQNILALLHSAKGSNFTVNVIFLHKGFVPPQIIFELFALLVVQNKHKPV